MTRFSAVLGRFPRASAVACAAGLRSALGWVVAFPLMAALSALNVGSLPDGDRALFAPSALLLVETLRLGEVPLTAAAQTSLLLWLLCALVQALPAALVFTAFAGPPAALGALCRRALALTPRFVALGALDCLLCALTFGFGLLAWPAATSSSGDGHYGLVALAVGWALLLAAGISVFIDLARLASLEPGNTLRRGLDDAAAEFRKRWFGLLAGYLLASGAGALCLTLASRGVELCRIEEPGALRLALVFALHQLVLLALTTIQAAWVRRLSTREDHIGLSPRTAHEG